MEKYPNREHCIIGTLDDNMANDFGKPYIVIPFDGAIFGIAPGKDMWWTSFKKACDQVVDNTTNSVDKKEMLSTSTFDLKKAKEFISKVNHSWLDILTKTPEQFGFKLMNAIKLFSSVWNDNEVWTDSKCLLIRQDKFYELEDLILDGVIFKNNDGGNL